MSSDSFQFPLKKVIKKNNTGVYCTYVHKRIDKRVGTIKKQQNERISKICERGWIDRKEEKT